MEEQVQQEHNPVPQEKVEASKGGFGGWLVFPMLWVIFFPIYTFLFLLGYTGEDSTTVIISGLLTVIIPYIWLNYLMFRKKKLFAKAYIIINSLPFLLFGYNIVESYITLKGPTPPLGIYLLPAIVYLVVLVLFIALAAYLLKSGRAKNTFVN